MGFLQSCNQSEASRWDINCQNRETSDGADAIQATTDAAAAAAAGRVSTAPLITSNGSSYESPNISIPDFIGGGAAQKSFSCGSGNYLPLVIFDTASKIPMSTFSGIYI